MSYHLIPTNYCLNIKQDKYQLLQQELNNDIDKLIYILYCV